MAGSGGVLELEFNEEQKAALARALMAVAEAEAHTRDKQSTPIVGPLKHGDVVDLLSDSESNSDCELLGVLSEDPEEDQSAPLQLVPFELKVELKQEIGMDSEVPQELVPEAEVTTTASTGHPRITPVIGIPGLPCTTTAFLVQQPQTENNHTQPDANAVEWPVPFEMVKEDSEAMETPVESVDPNDMQTDTIVIGDVSSLTATFTTDQAEWSLSDLEEVDNSCDTYPIPIVSIKMDSEDDVCNDDACSTITEDNVNNDPDYKPDFDEQASNDDDIINLDSGEEEEMETKVISLLESDMEGDVDSDDSQAVKTASRDRPKTKTELIHLICPECGLDCGPPHKWKSHTESMHEFRSIAKLNLQTIIDRVGVICYQCKFCQLKFKTGTLFSKLLAHRISHMPFSKYLKCRLCEEFKPNMPLMNKHLRQEHYKIYQHYKRGGFSVYQYVEFHCPVCNKQLANYTNWRKHLIEAHDYFEKKADRVRPVRDNIVACNECDKEFTKGTVNRHLLLHEEHHSFHCKLCQTYTGITLWHLSLHVRNKHGQGGKYLYRCLYCEKAYNNSGLRSRHMRRAHQKEKLCCQVCKKKFNSLSLLVSHMNMKGHHKLK